MKQHIYKNGNFQEIVDVDTICNSIKELVDSADRRAQRANTELEKLLNEKWKDEELQEMKAKLAEMKASYYQGFPISDSEDEAIKNWKDQHYTNQHNAPDMTSRIQMQGVSGGLFTYIFLPTSIGTSGTCRCNSCYKKAQFNTGYPEEYVTINDYYKELEYNIKKYDAEFEFQHIL